MPQDSAPDVVAYELALWYATVSAKPLTSAEKRAAIERLIAERPELSDRAIGRLVGVSNSTVSSHRRALCASHTPADGDDQPRRQSGGGEPLRWRLAARRLAEDVDELLASCQKFFGGGDFKSAGRELYDALADLYDDEDALEVIDELSAVVGSAQAHARKVARVE